MGVRATDYLDCGALGCLGVGVPSAIAAALVRPEAPVFALIGDGSFGFTAMELDTAVRHRANVVLIIANNEAWNIGRHDQIDRYDGNLVGVDLPVCRRFVYPAHGGNPHVSAEEWESAGELNSGSD